MNKGKFALGIIAALLLLPFALALDANVINTTDSAATIRASSDEVVDFTIFYGTSVDDLSSSTLALDTSYTETELAGLTRATKYYYYVQACTETNCTQSEMASFTTAPPVITVAASELTDTSARINLTSDLPVNFTLYFGPDNTSGTVQAGYDTTESSIVLQELQENTEYSVIAYGCAHDVCGQSEIMTFQTLGIRPELNVSITAVTETSASFSANSSENSTFTITFGQSPDNLYGNMNAGTSLSTQATLNELVPGTLYYYDVQTCDAAGLCTNVDGSFMTLQNNTGDTQTSENQTNQTNSTTDGDTTGGTEHVRTISSGSSSGDCAWGYDRVDGRCVHEAQETTPVASEPAVESPVADEAPAAVVPAASQESFTADDNLITGDVTGNGGSAQWYWLLGIAGLIMVGGIMYFVLRRQ